MEPDWAEMVDILLARDYSFPEAVELSNEMKRLWESGQHGPFVVDDSGNHPVVRLDC